MKIPDIIFSAGFDRALGWTMLHSIWQATLIALLAGILLLLLRRQSARLRYGVANLALLAVLLTSAATFCYYLQSSPGVGGAAVVIEQHPLSIVPITEGSIETITPPASQG